MIVFSFYKILVVMDGISTNDLFQASAFSKGSNGKCAKGFFTILICLQYEPVFVRISFKFGSS